MIAMAPTATRPQKKPHPAKKVRITKREVLRVFGCRTPPDSPELELETRLALFAGFHDGDGSVDATVSIYFPQAASNHRILNLLVAEFGGKVAETPVRSNHAPALYWRLRVNESIAYAKAILPYVLQSRKRHELEILAKYRESNLTRTEFKSRIEALRQVPDDEIYEDDVLSRMTVNQVDAYFAGFFFADGCARFAGKTTTVLELSQKEGNHAILRFAGRFYGCGNISGDNWTVCGTASRALAALLIPYLPTETSKREMTELVHDVTEENWEASHARHFEIAGGRASALSRKKNAKGCISKVFRKGVHVGYQGSLGVHYHTSSSNDFTIDEHLARVNEWLVVRVRERIEEFTTPTPATTEAGSTVGSKKPRKDVVSEAVCGA